MFVEEISVPHRRDGKRTFRPGIARTTEAKMRFTQEVVLPRVLHY
jgi:hypothetical protein